LDAPSIACSLRQIRFAPPQHGPVYMLKVDLSDGFYRVWLRPSDVPVLGVALPSLPDEEPLVAFPLILPMGWCESPPYFCCALTETVADLTNDRTSLPIGTRPRTLWRISLPPSLPPCLDTPLPPFRPRFAVPPHLPPQSPEVPYLPPLEFCSPPSVPMTRFHCRFPSCSPPSVPIKRFCCRLPSRLVAPPRPLRRPCHSAPPRTTRRANSRATSLGPRLVAQSWPPRRPASYNRPQLPFPEQRPLYGRLPRQFCSLPTPPLRLPMFMLTTSLPSPKVALPEPIESVESSSTPSMKPSAPMTPPTPTAVCIATNSHTHTRQHASPVRPPLLTSAYVQSCDVERVQVRMSIRISTRLLL
jgi:hypothetical protein